MTARLALPLPECPGCDKPVRRAVAEANGGLCSGCAAAAAEHRRPVGMRPLFEEPSR